MRLIRGNLLPTPRTFSARPIFFRFSVPAFIFFFIGDGAFFAERSLLSFNFSLRLFEKT
jgi:hypothetical protein